MTKQAFGNPEQFKLYKMYKSAKCHTKRRFVLHTLHLNTIYVQTIAKTVVLWQSTKVDKLPLKWTELLLQKRLSNTLIETVSKKKIIMTDQEQKDYELGIQEERKRILDILIANCNTYHTALMGCECSVQIELIS